MVSFARTWSRLFYLLICFVGVFTQEWGTLTICVISNPNDQDQLHKQCGNLEKTTSKRLKCVYAVDRLRCLEQLMNGKADLGVFKAEDLLLASVINNQTVNDLVITNEFRFIPDQPYEFDMVVVVSNDIEVNQLSDLRGKRLCHPGFDENGWLNDWSEVFSQYFEELVVPEDCDPKLSVFENKIKSLHNFFGPSCKPGSWLPDLLTEKKLKSKYRDLCKKCNNPIACSEKDLYWGRTGPIMCLTDCNGDVAWLRLQDFRTSFKLRSSSFCHNVSFLCPDGTKQAIDSVNPCVWISHPWPLIVTRNSVSNDVTKLINFVNNSSETYHTKTWEYLLRILLNLSFQPIKMITPISISDYLHQIPGFLNANTIPTCKGTGQDKTITICVQNNATFEKCRIMSNVARIYAIDPEFQCGLSNDCLTNVSRGDTEVTIISTERLRQAYEKKNLKAILYQTHLDYSSLRHTAAVVKASSSIRSIKDLKGKLACFTEENGLGWNAVLMTLKEKSLIEDDCRGASAMKKFFSNICIINSKPGDEFPTCFPDDEEKPTGALEVNEALGLRCVSEGGGDVAFIDYNALGKYLRYNFDAGVTQDNFRSICPNENSSIYDCYLTWASYGQVLVREDISAGREEEIVSAFLLLSSLFGDGNPSSASSPIFKLFSHYQNETNVLFQSPATKLETAQKYGKRGSARINNYEIKLKNNVQKCFQEKISASKSVISLPVIRIYVFQILFIIFLSIQ